MRYERREAGGDGDSSLCGLHMTDYPDAVYFQIFV